MRPLYLCIFFVALIHLAQGLLADIFGSGMILQREPHSANIWGKLQGKNPFVSVFFHNRFYNTNGDSNGNWMISLPPTAAGGPYEIDVTHGSGKVKLKDVYFGDVFFCSGQANMAMTVKEVFNATAEIKHASKYSNIRIFKSGRNIDFRPQNESAAPLIPWTTPNETIANFSAVCWFFGKDLFDRTKVIPIGLIESTYGGSMIQSWSPKSAYDQCKDPYPPGGLNPGALDKNDPSAVYNGQVYPYRNFHLKSVIWYQGESNVQHPDYYKCAIKALIPSWRQAFNNPSLHFYYVQLSSWSSNFDLPSLRLAQNAALKLGNVGFAVSLDLEDVSSPRNPMHPRNKQEVGRRLALQVQGYQYGSNSTWLGPNITQILTSKQKNFTLVKFDFSKNSVGSGLTLRTPTKCPVKPVFKLCGVVAELQTADGTWYKCNYFLIGNSLVFSIHTSSTEVIAARYLWSDWPRAVLYNSNNLPLPPFNLRIPR